MFGGGGSTKVPLLNMKEARATAYEVTTVYCLPGTKHKLLILPYMHLLFPAPLQVYSHYAAPHLNRFA